MRISNYSRVILWLVVLLQIASLNAQPPDNLNDIAWNSDGTYVAAAFDRGQIEVWHVATSTLVWSTSAGELPVLDWHPTIPGELAYSSYNGRLTLVDVVSDTPLLSVDSPLYTVSVAYHPRGTSVLLASNEREVGPRQEGFVRVIDRVSGQSTVVFETVFLPVTDAKWKPDGQQIFALNDGELVTWDAITGQIITQSSRVETVEDEFGFTYDTGHIRAFDFKPEINTSTLAIIDAIDISILTLPNFVEQARSLVFGNSEVAWNPDGTLLAIATGNSREVKIVEAVSLNTVNTLTATTTVDALAWNPTGTLIAYGGTAGAQGPVIVPVSGENVIPIDPATNSIIQPPEEYP